MRKLNLYFYVAGFFVVLFTTICVELSRGFFDHDASPVFMPVANMVLDVFCVVLYTLLGFEKRKELIEERNAAQLW